MFSGQEPKNEHSGRFRGLRLAVRAPYTIRLTFAEGKAVNCVESVANTDYGVYSLTICASVKACCCPSPTLLEPYPCDPSFRSFA
ncbi:MAG: hypothetical protein JWP89_7089 [Schlesneria sp.]|nr:hypothetical protein [Schlesneria sp.]